MAQKYKYKSEPFLNGIGALLGSDASLQAEVKKSLRGGCALIEVRLRDGNVQKWILDSNRATFTKIGDLNDGKADAGSSANAEAVNTRNADVVLTLDDAQLVRLGRGKVSAQRLFLMGKLKVKGDVARAAIVERLLKAGAARQPKL